MCASDNQITLRWNQFHSAIRGTFQDLRHDQNFSNVTLACDDGQVLAHKVILSACSTFFSRVLRENPHPHPLIYLFGVDMRNLSLILDFMYAGETQVRYFSSYGKF